MKSGVLVIDKPRGPTSHDVVAVVRRALGTREVGHAGTLDPMATGVLVVAVGEATKLASYLTAADKAYETTVRLGFTTDTLDADGRVTEEKPISPELRAALVGPREPLHPGLERALAAERARKEQVPPSYSAIQEGGERAYARARRGEAVKLAPRPVRVHALSLLATSLEPEPEISVALDVEKGYFVRAFGRDLAERLGTVGHLVALRRTRSGAFTLDEALPIDTPADELAARLITLDHAAERALPVSRLTEAGARDARHGRRVRPPDLDARVDGPSAWLDPAGRLIAVGERADKGSGRVLRGFR